MDHGACSPTSPPVPGLAAAQHNPRRPARSSAVRAAALPKLGLAISATKNAAEDPDLLRKTMVLTDNCWLYQEFVGNTHTHNQKKTGKFTEQKSVRTKEHQ